jgi:hypothetical protein
MDIRKDLQDLREKLGRLRQDPPSFNLAVAAVLLAVGLAGVTVPMGGSLDAKRRELADARERAAVAERLGEQLRAWHAAAPRIVPDAEAVEWGDYLLEHLRAAGLRVLSQERPEIAELGEFRTITLRLRAGGRYPQMTDFLDRVERGERLMRVDRLQIAIGEAELELDLEIVGLAGTAPAEWSPEQGGGVE